MIDVPPVVDASTPTENRATDEPKRVIDWERGREAYEERGLSLREIGALVGASAEGVRKRAAADGWERSDGTVAARDAQRRAHAQAAIEATKVNWAHRRADEADEAAATAKIARLRLTTAMAESDWHMVRAASIAYGILIDKAQLLTGGATSRTDLTGAGDQLARSRSTRDELAERREQLAS